MQIDLRDRTAIVTGAGRGIGRAYAHRLAAYGDAVKWADYGLDKPEYTVTVTLAGEKPTTHTLQLGKTDPLGGRFVRVDGGKAVGVAVAVAVLGGSA